MKQVGEDDLEQITEIIKKIIKRTPTCYKMSTRKPRGLALWSVRK